MEFILNAVKYVAENYEKIVSLGVGLISAVIGICLLIPGEQPEKFLQGVLDFLAKFSRKSNQ